MILGNTFGCSPIFYFGFIQRQNIISPLRSHCRFATRSRRVVVFILCHAAKCPHLEVTDLKMGWVNGQRPSFFHLARVRVGSRTRRRKRSKESKPCIAGGEDIRSRRNVWLHQILRADMAEAEAEVKVGTAVRFPKAAAFGVFLGYFLSRDKKYHTLRPRTRRLSRRQCERKKAIRQKKFPPHKREYPPVADTYYSRHN